MVTQGAGAPSFCFDDIVVGNQKRCYKILGIWLLGWTLHEVHLFDVIFRSPTTLIHSFLGLTFVFFLCFFFFCFFLGFCSSFPPLLFARYTFFDCPAASALDLSWAWIPLTHMSPFPETPPGDIGQPLPF